VKVLPWSRLDFKKIDCYGTVSCTVQCSESAALV
jgi:hypothetical protein